VIAADTNVIVRLLTGDDPHQTEEARRLFETETIFLPKTVLLEAEWVLRRIYRLDSRRVTKALYGLISLPNVQCEGEATVRRALDLKRDGLDFADALHFASSGMTSRFATFDQRMIRTAAKMGLAVSIP
jgi:predicted nucleic acid-binding protein